jgi:succinoglycan biosynthesis protein ExoA
MGAMNLRSIPDLKYDERSVLIVIPTLNEAAHIRTCLLGLHAQAPTAAIVVVDGNSTDNTRQIVRDLMCEITQLVLLKNDRRIQSCGINLAVSQMAEMNHKILIRCDVHATYPDDFIAKILNDFNERDVASVVVAMDAIGQNAFAKGAAWIVDTVLGNGGAKHRGARYTGLVDHGHHAGMRLDWFHSISGYDTAFSHNEDAEYDHRITRAGGKIWMNGDTRISYHMRSSLFAILRQYFNYGMGRARTCAKHGLRPKLRQSLPTLNLLCLLFCLVGAVWWPWLGILPIMYVLGLFGVSIVAALKLGNMSGLWAGPALAAMHNAWAVGFLRMRLRGAKHA